jgi:hypothetical protein
MILERQFSTLSRYNHDPKDHTYQTIIRVMQELWNRGLLQRFDGECIAASDILQHALSQAGISSRLVEVQLSIVSQDPRSGMIWHFVGFNNNFVTQGVDTHMIVITETETPWLLDLSIAKTIGGDSPWIVEPLIENSELHIAKYQIERCQLIYHPKQNIKLMGLHQKTLLERISSGHNMTKWIHRLIIISLIGLGLGVINAIFNVSLIALRIISM